MSWEPADGGQGDSKVRTMNCVLARRAVLLVTWLTVADVHAQCTGSGHVEITKFTGQAVAIRNFDGITGDCFNEAPLTAVGTVGPLECPNTVDGGDGATVSMTLTQTPSRIQISGSVSTAALSASSVQALQGFVTGSLSVRAVDGPVQLTITTRSALTRNGIVQSDTTDGPNTFVLEAGASGNFSGEALLQLITDAPFFAPRSASTLSGVFYTMDIVPLPQTTDTLHWINPEGGDYDIAANWDPARVPQNALCSDAAVFDIPTNAAIPVTGSAATAGRWEILDTAIQFSGDATLGSTAALPPSLALGFGGNLNYQSGFLTTQHSVIGSGPPGSQLTLGANTTWFNLGTLKVGANDGPGFIDLSELSFLDVNGHTEVGSGSDGELLIDAGAVAQMHSDLLIGSILGGSGSVTVSGSTSTRRSRLQVTGYTGVGNPLAPSGSPGFLTVTRGAEMQLTGDLGISQMIAGAGAAAVSIEDSTATVHGTILVGELGPGDMLIQSGASVDCTTLTLGSPIAGASGALGLVGLGSGIVVDQNVQVGGEGGHGVIDVGTGTSLNVTGNVTVGHVGGGELLVNPQAQATVGNGLSIGSFAGGAGAVVVSGAASTLQVTGPLAVGVGPEISAGSLTIRNQGRVTLTGDLQVDDFVSDPLDAAVEILGSSILDVTGNIIVGVLGPADVIVSGAGAGCNDLTIGGGVHGAFGLVTLETGGLMFVENAQIGGAGGHGLMQIDSGAFLDVRGTMTVGSTQGGLVTVNGEVTGTGRVLANPGGIIDGIGHIRTTKVLNGGVIAPGLSPGILSIDGDYEQADTGALVIVVAGLAPDQFSVLEVTGTVTLGGTLEVRFLDGFLPKTGDVFPFLGAGGAITGTFHAVHVAGVAPGFDFSVGVANGQLVLTALTDAQPAACADAGDADVDGVACDDDCPFAADADQTDHDGDRAGDACDPCLNGSVVTKPKLRLKKGKLSFSGSVSFAAAPVLDPLTTGVRLLVADAAQHTIVDLTAPPGAFDKSTKRGWKKLGFRSRTGPITAATLVQRKKTPARIAFALKADVSGLDATTIQQPVTATLLFDAAASPTTACGDARFTGPPGINPVCTLKRDALTCSDRKRPR